MVYKKLKNCRLCNFNSFNNIIKLNPTPPANNLTNRKSDLSKSTPLEVVKCKKCSHVQLRHLVNEDILFKNYNYRTGLSSEFNVHFKNFTKRYNKILSKGSILEIGSNDATLLNHLSEINENCFGIEPTRNFNKFYKKNIKLVNGFFNSSNSKKLYNLNKGPFNIIIANNVFAHIEKIQDFTKNISKIMGQNSIFIFEVSYLGDVIKNNYFDTIYHEHMSYHSLQPLIRFFKKYDLNLVDAERIKTHGGSIRAFVSKSTKTKKSLRLKKLISDERKMRLDKLDTFKVFEKSILNNKKKIINILNKYKNKGYTICGFTAPAKATSLIHFYEIQRFINCIYDDNGLKQNKYIPGTDIVIKKPKKTKSNSQIIPIIFAWNIQKQIIKKCMEYNYKKIILPLPHAKIKNI